MDQETKNILDQHTQKLEEIYISVEKTRKYFRLTLILTVVFMVLPLIGMIFVLPMAMDAITGGLQLPI